MIPDTLSRHEDEISARETADYAAFLAGMDLHDRGYMLKSIANPFARKGWLTAQASTPVLTYETGWAKYENGQPEGDCGSDAERNGWQAALRADATCDMPTGYCDALGI